MTKSPKKRKEPEKARSYRKEDTHFLLKFFVLVGVLLFLETSNPVTQKVLLPHAAILARVGSLLLNLFRIGTISSGTLISSPPVYGRHQRRLWRD